MENDSGVRWISAEYGKVSVYQGLKDVVKELNKAIAAEEPSCKV